MKLRILNRLKTSASTNRLATPTPLDGLKHLDSIKVDKTIAPGDEMFVPGDEAHYFQVGASALHCIKLALSAAHSQGPQRILDLPCGHGRVMRMLKAEFPQAELTAVDLNRPGVDFCAAQFGAKPIYSATQPTQIPLVGPYDLVWCGSLLTHLEAERWGPFLELFSKHTRPGGVVVFTTCGLRSYHWLHKQEVTYGLAETSIKQLIDAYEAGGFGYVDYEGQPGYGISLSTSAWVMQQIVNTGQLRLVLFMPQGWDNHQDVWACIRD